jgi:hypothetical protein
MEMEMRMRGKRHDNRWSGIRGLHLSHRDRRRLQEIEIRGGSMRACRI